MADAPDLTKQGPWLASALICERVLDEKDSVLSLVRVVDRVVQQAIGTEVPSEMPPLQLQGMRLVIMLKSGGARGRHAVKIRPEAPSGQHLPLIEIPVHLEGENRGVNLILNLDLVLEQEGVYWFDVILDDGPDVLTRVPLQAVYAPQKQTTG